MPQRRFIVIISGQNCQVRREDQFNCLSGLCPSLISHSIARILLGKESAVIDGTSLLFRKCAPYRSLGTDTRRKGNTLKPSITAGLQLANERAVCAGAVARQLWRAPLSATLVGQTDVWQVDQTHSYLPGASNMLASSGTLCLISSTLKTSVSPGKLWVILNGYLMPSTARQSSR